AAGARGRATQGDGDSTGAWRKSIQARAAGVDGKPVAGFGGRGCGNPARGLVARAVIEAEAALHSTTGRMADRRLDASVYAGGDSDRRVALRRLAGVAFGSR